ncbi:MAG TPA: hypothetical protein VMJ32_11475 [Pirellulales bacterium]|nr:hypothetical protein [Pirellulales bacterium]
MSQSIKPAWEGMRTEQTRDVENLFRKTFPQTDAYRYNSASIRVRVIDDRFEGKSDDEREAMVQPILDQFPPRTREDIINLLTLSPSEVTRFNRKTLLNDEFDDPSPSRL